MAVLGISFQYSVFGLHSKRCVDCTPEYLIVKVQCFV